MASARTVRINELTERPTDMTLIRNKPGHFLRNASRALLGWSSAFAVALAPVVNTAAPTNGAAQSTSATPNYIQITAENAQMSKRVKLGLDKSIVIDLPADAHDILVANPDVADAVTRTSRRIYIFGKEIGQTNVFVFDGTGRQIASLELTIERDIAGLEETISRLIPNSNVRGEMINDNLVLTGTVPTPQASAKAARLANIFVTGGEQTGGGETDVVSLFGDDPSSQIVNLLRIEGEDQVHLKVVVAEIQRSVVKQLGINTSVSRAATNGFGFNVFGGPVAALTPSASFSGGNLTLDDPQGAVSSIYNALERNGVMRTLAEPSLTAISGEEAHFRAGGTYNIPESVSDDEDGQTTIGFREVEYGVALSFKPVVLTEGRISLKIRTEVSEPTAQGVPTFRSDANILSVRRRMADTTVELPSGGSMVIAGLIQDDVRQTVNGQPGLKDIPIFGALFRSREFHRDETEIVVIVTPYLVRPTARAKLTQPDENFQPASDAAGYFIGRINRVYGTKQGDLPKGRYSGSIGFILK